MDAPEVYVGTSGFSFDDWKGPVYPERLPAAQWLTYYEQQLGFNVLEINYTYYQMPSHRTLTGLLRKTTPRFKFAVKANRAMTHDVIQKNRAIADNPKAFTEFREGLKPMEESGRLECVLTQFPYGFPNTPPNRDYLDRVLDRLKGLETVVEFRHRSWVAPEIFEHLRARRAGFCVVDEPQLPNLMPWVGEVTSDIAYARLHGRNAAAWFGSSGGERYNYNYSDPELRELLTKLDALRKQGRTLMVFLNNCHAGAAARNAKRLRDMFLEAGWSLAGGGPLQEELSFDR
jgi:uncharacterized protein YecE (DUF72 family)